MSTRAQLDQLFASLQAQNITAVQQCGWSMNDGLAELEEHRQPGHTGFCFFHVIAPDFRTYGVQEQDAWRVAAGSKLYLAYGTYQRAGSSAMAVAELVYAAARACGLAVRWDGSLGTRMEVGGFNASEFGDWQEPAASDEDEEGNGVEEGEESEGGKGVVGHEGLHPRDSDSSGDGNTAGEADGSGVGPPRVVLPPYMAGHTTISPREVDRTSA